MHEQSVIVVQATLNPDVLIRGLRHVASTCGVLSTRWLGDSLRDEGEGAIAFESAGVDHDREVMVRARAILRQDLDRGFAPGELLFRTWAIQGPSTSAMAMAWHNAVLDGWSHATLVRLLREAYSALSMGRQPPPAPGAHIAEFRSWCAKQADSSTWWRDALGSAAWPEQSTERVGYERSVSQTRTICAVADLERAVGTDATPVVAAITLAAHALLDAAAADGRSPIGVRMSLRPAELVGSLRMIGQATLEAPLLFQPSNGADDAMAASAQIAAARAHGHIGEIGIRRAAGCPDARDLFQLLVVPETELADDEWAVRVGEVHGWPEVATWRREVSPSRHTVYVHLDYGVVSFRVSSVWPDASALADKVQLAAERVLRSWLSQPTR
jgi:hypothetical protein